MVKYSSKKVSNKKKRVVSVGIVKIQASFNNTIVSVTDVNGNLLCWSSAGKHGFKGSRKATPYAAQVATKNAIEAAREYGLNTASVEITGPGVGREASLRELQAMGVAVTVIIDNTNAAHNGCRAPKRRRV